MTRQIADLAAALGRGDAADWASKADELVEAFMDAWNPDWGSTFDRGLQSNQVLGLALDPATDNEDAADALVTALEQHGNHQMTGILGTKFLYVERTLPLLLLRT